MMWPEVIDGMPVKAGKHSAGYGVRLIVACQHHPDCWNKRQVYMTANLGAKEPIAFLAVWGRLGEGIPKERHRTAGVQLEYLDEHGEEYAL